MPVKMLYEFVSLLRILIIGEEENARAYLGDEHLSHCKKLMFASTADEALGMYEAEQIDLVIINLEKCGRDTFLLISQIFKKDIYQRILVSSSRFNDAEIVLKLSNAGVSGFINKSLDVNESFSLFMRVFMQIHDRNMLVHYVKDMEEQILEALYVPCKADCPRDGILHKHTIPAPEMIDDDFEFFPTPPTSCSNASSANNTAPIPTVDKSMYKDYFSFLMLDDKEELRDQLSDIDTFLFNAFGESQIADVQYISVLGHAIARFGNILMHYQFFSDTGMFIIELGQTISEKSTIIAEKSGDFEPLLSGFCSVLQAFIAQVWDKEAEDPKFFNDSIMSDARMITDAITPPVMSFNSTDDDDLIFF